MKMFNLFLFAIVLFVLSETPLAQSCCEPAGKFTFASLGDNKEFRDIHQLPNDFKLTDPKGEMIEFATKDGMKGKGYFIKSKSKSDKYIFVFHEWWGLNDNIKREADELVKNLGDINVLAIDLYDGKVAVNREDATKYMQSVDNKRAMNIIEGAIEFAGKDAQVGTLGWCFGGGWSLQASIMLGKQGKACVMYYGIIENTPETFKDLNAPVLGIFAEKDGWITPEVYGNLEKNLKAAGKSVTIKSYNADHAFANPSNPQFDEKATKDAMSLTLNFFKENLIK